MRFYLIVLERHLERSLIGSGAFAFVWRFGKSPGKVLGASVLGSIALAMGGVLPCFYKYNSHVPILRMKEESRQLSIS